MNLQPIIKNKEFIKTLSEDECVTLCAEYSYKRISDPKIKKVISLLRRRRDNLRKFNPLRITKDQTLLNLFEKYKNYPEIVNMLTVEELEEIEELLQGKSAIQNHIKQLRNDCRNRLLYLNIYANRVERAIRDLPALQNSLGELFNLTEQYWKRINKMITTDPQHITKTLKYGGRTLGLAINDLPNVYTNLYSINALRNICKHRSTDHAIARIVDEHFWSLYTYAGSQIIEMALERGLKWDINHLTQAAFGFNQTCKTTKKENSQLSTYHENNDLINPQISYDEANISELIYCPRLMEEEVMMKWRFMHELVELDYAKTPHKPFRHILKLDEAIEKYPEIKKIRKYLKL